MPVELLLTRSPAHRGGKVALGLVPDLDRGHGADAGRARDRAGHAELRPARLRPRAARRPKVPAAAAPPRCYSPLPLPPPLTRYAQLPVAVPAGTVTVYMLHLMHRGTANTHSKERPFFFFTLMGRGIAP